MRKGFFPRLALSGIRKNRSIYYPYILTAVLTTAMMYIMGSLQNASTIIRARWPFRCSWASWSHPCSVWCFCFTPTAFSCAGAKRSSACTTSWAWKKRHLARLILWETALMLVISLALGLAAGVLLDKLMHLALSRLVGQTASLTFALSPGPCDIRPC